MKDKTVILRQLNDAFRKAGLSGKTVLTEGVCDLGGIMLHKIRAAIAAYDGFSKDEGNDPYGEHDFGSVQIDDHKIFWKIDYYNPDMLHGSENPADPNVTVRVMTIMLASEY